MPNNNPSGVNSFQPFAPEPAYGMKTAEAQMEQAAPLPANPALNAPRRGARRVKRGGGSQPQPEPMVAPPHMDATQVPSYRAQLAATWAQVAATPGASPLVQQIAQEAQTGGV